MQKQEKILIFFKNLIIIALNLRVINKVIRKLKKKYYYLNTVKKSLKFRIVKKYAVLHKRHILRHAKKMRYKFLYLEHKNTSLPTPLKSNPRSILWHSTKKKSLLREYIKKRNNWRKTGIRFFFIDKIKLKLSRFNCNNLKNFNKYFINNFISYYVYKNKLTLNFKFFKKFKTYSKLFILMKRDNFYFKDCVYFNKKLVYTESSIFLKKKLKIKTMFKLMDGNLLVFLLRYFKKLENITVYIGVNIKKKRRLSKKGIKKYTKTLIKYRAFSRCLKWYEFFKKIKFFKNKVKLKFVYNRSHSIRTEKLKKRRRK